MDKLSIELTKEQWEEVYQWFLVVKEERNLELFEEDDAEKIKKALINEFGSFH